jgi:hypothetical protein
LDESGDYYIVIDGHTETESGNFTITIGEMLTFSDYEIGFQNNIVEYIHVEFSDNVYGVDNPSDWTLTAPTFPNFNFIYDNADHFHDQITDSDGNDIVIEEYLSNPLDAFRYYILSASIPAGSEVTVVPTGESWGPSPVNVYGIPFAFDDTLIIEIAEPPVIDSIFSISAENATFSVEFSEGIYSSNNGTGGVRRSHFEIETVGADLSPSITLIMNADETAAPQGAEDDSLLVFNLEYGSLSSGSESVRIRANEDAVYNASGVPMQTEWSNSLQLNDLLPPYVAEYSFSNETNSGVDPS